MAVATRLRTSSPRRLSTQRRTARCPDSRDRGRAWAGNTGVVVGRSAAALHGTRWIDPDRPAEIAVARSRPPADIVAVRDRIPSDEVCEVDGVTATTPARTAYDLGRRLPFEPAVVLLDALCRATGCSVSTIEEVADRHMGARGVTRLRAALREVDPGAESPPETLTRLLLVAHGLPRPVTQPRIRGGSGRVIARADLGWPQWKVLVEYDGAQHWTDRRQRAWDIDRAAILDSLGWVVIRVSADLLDRRPWDLIERVTCALRSVGAPV